MAPAQAAQSASVAVDYGQTVRALSPLNYGATITGYGHGATIANDAVHRGHMSALRARTMRIDLGYRTPGDPTSGLVCGGDWCDTTITADAWLEGIRQANGDPVIVLPHDARHSVEIDKTDAVNIYRHFADQGKPIRRFILGNEPDNAEKPESMTAAVYSSRFNVIADALRAIDPAVKIGGPATAWYDEPYIETVLSSTGDRMSFVDFHKYGQGGPTDVDDATLLGSHVRGFADDVASLRAQINRLQPARAAQIDILIGEWNLDWDGDPRTLTPFNTVWGAAVVGTALAAGATPVQYGDKNGQLGLTSENGEGGFSRNTPLPIYHGIAAFTGQNLFRSFGAKMVKATSSNPLLYAFASDNEKNIVLVNTATEAMTTSLTFAGLGGSATAEVWQTTGGAQARNGSVSIAGGAGSISLPARSVTTLVIGAVAAEPTGLSATYFDNMDLTGASVSRVDPAVNFDWGTAAPAAGIGVDTFSVRWTGQVQIDTPGTYTFIASTDDGSRLWIDGTQVVNAWVDHSYRDDTGQIALAAGKHTVRFEYFENGYDARAELSWSGPGLARQIIPTTKLSPTVPKINGLAGTYFDNMDLTGASVSRVDPAVNFNWAQGAPATGIGPDTFSVRWTGEVQVDTAGTYTFIVSTDDGARLWVDGTQVVNAWVDHSYRDDTGQIALTSGRHTIRLEYFDNTYDARAELSWSGPGLARQIIPNGKLFTEPVAEPPPTGDPISRTTGIFLDPNQYAAVWARENSGDPRASKIANGIGNKPTSFWFGNWNTNLTADITAVLDAAGTKLPILVAYNIPNRDCGGHSGGGAGTPEAYRAWISTFASAIGNRPAIVIIEPDAAPQLACLPTEADRQARVDLLKYATEQLRDKATGAWSYMDIGNKGWLATDEAARILDRVGGRNVRGFSLNVSNYFTTAETNTYAAALNASLQAQFGYTRTHLVDTSRNGNGSNGDWCNPAGRKIGQAPQIGGGPAELLLWVKGPGTSDGPCGIAPTIPAGQFSPDLAVHLIDGV